MHRTYRRQPCDCKKLRKVTADRSLGEAMPQERHPSEAQVTRCVAERPPMGGLRANNGYEGNRPGVSCLTELVLEKRSAAGRPRRWRNGY